MLEALTIENLAIIDRVTVHLAPGLNVLTGETGAGKSIVIDAVSLVLGGRSHSDMVRSGCEKAAIEAIFSVGHLPLVRRRLQELGLGDDEQLVLSREILSSGRSLGRVNGRLTTVSVLRELGELLVDIHGQHEHQSLLKSSAQLALLDAFGGDQLATCRLGYAQVYEQWKVLEQRRQRLAGDELERARRIDLWRYEIAELTQAKLTADEDELLAQAAARLTHAVKLAELVEAVLDQLYGGSQQRDAAAAVATSVDLLTEAARLDGDLAPLIGLVQEIGYQLEDVTDRVRSYGQHLTFDPQELRLVQERLDILAKLKRKYGATGREMLLYLERARQQLAEWENASALADELEQEVERARRQALETAAALRQAREPVARALEDRITKALHKLGMPQASFAVELRAASSGQEVACPDGPSIRLNAQGMDEVTFYISANPGEPVRPLARVASGGELSRIMLALRSVLALQEDVPTLIFDEVDAGVGGMTSLAVAEQLAQVGRSRQVLCVTHLAVIAAHASCHLVVAKQAQAQRTLTSVDQLSPDQRPQELARMLGVVYAGAGAEHARQLLQQGQSSVMSTDK